MPIPLNGQGNPLPPNFPYRGEWILEPRMFLYVPDQAEATASNAPRFTASLNDNGDDWCFGFDYHGASIDRARKAAADAGVTANTSFEVAQAKAM